MVDQDQIYHCLIPAAIGLLAPVSNSHANEKENQGKHL
jgi:hypothetical protein